MVVGRRSRDGVSGAAGDLLRALQPLLGTNVEIRVDARASSDEGARRLATTAEGAAVEEMVRLQAVFTVFDPASELCRWRSGYREPTSPELVECLAAAETWWRASGGAFHPASASLRALWLEAERHGRPPGERALAEAVARLATLPYAVVGDRVQRTGDCSGVDLNAIAKGYVVDRAVATAADLPGVVDVLVNAGGDLRHDGDRVLDVGVEDPADPAGPPVTVLRLGVGAIATSGSVHCGFRVDGVWRSHVIDPRTGYPVEARPSSTVRAPDALTADAVATVVNVLGWPDAAPVVEAAGIAVLTVDPSGGILRGGNWAHATERT